MNKTLNQIQPSATLAIASRARSLAASGHKVCNFSIGEPDFDTPQKAKEGAIQALLAGQTKYTPIAGIKELCAAITEKLKRENNLDYETDQIIVSCGAKHSLANACLAVCNPGDEVIVPAPYWVSYPEMVRIAGGKPVFVSGSESNGLKIQPQQLKEAITDRTVALILNSPSNPTGIVYTEDELRKLADVCVKHSVIIITDEIYEHLIYDDARHVSIASLSPEVYRQTITINGFSKAYAMTGWRVGYSAGPREIIKAMCTVQSHTVSPPTTFAQFGAVSALQECDQDVREMVAAFAERRQVMFDRLSSIPGLTCVRPDGAFYIFPNISSFGLDSRTFCERLIDQQQVATVPGISFGADEHIRLSYACSIEEIEEGMRRLRDFTASL